MIDQQKVLIVTGERGISGLMRAMVRVMEKRDMDVTVQVVSDRILGMDADRIIVDDYPDMTPKPVYYYRFSGPKSHPKHQPNPRGYRK